MLASSPKQGSPHLLPAHLALPGWWAAGPLTTPATEIHEYNQTWIQGESHHRLGELDVTAHGTPLFLQILAKD